MRSSLLISVVYMEPSNPAGNSYFHVDNSSDLVERGFVCSFQRKSGIAPIKAEFVLKNPCFPAVCSESDTSDEKLSGMAKVKKKRRGMNREREKQMAKASANVRKGSLRLCSSVIQKSKCKFGEKCTATHDVDAFLQNRPEDLGESCYVFDQRGYCPFSISCRFGKAHTNEDFSQKTKAPEQPYENTKNGNVAFHVASVRKRTYDFSPCVSALDSLPNITGCMEREKLKLDMHQLSGKPYLAPLTTVGNLPFRRMCVALGAEITCSEMSLCTSVLSGNAAEWSLFKRHPSEKYFGIQIAGGFPDTMARVAQMITDTMDVDFIDINGGCPLDSVNEKGAGCALVSRTNKLVTVMKAMSLVMKDTPLTIKLRTGVKEGNYTAHRSIGQMLDACPPQLITLHPRSKEQRYTKLADWSYVSECAEAAGNIPLWVCGDILSHLDYYERLENYLISGVMIGRGALIKPWIFTEIQEKRIWDISATERIDVMKRFVNYGLDHWGSDDHGIENTRRFMLEWLSFAYRYIPVGLLEVLPQRINERPPPYRGRNEMETLLSSPLSSDWVKITEIFLGKVPEGFLFVPKHNASSYSYSATGW